MFDRFFSSDWQKPFKITPENYPIDFNKNNQTVVVKVQEFGKMNANMRTYENILTPEEMEALSKVTFSSIEYQLEELSNDVDFKKLT